MAGKDGSVRMPNGLFFSERQHTRWLPYLSAQPDRQDARRVNNRRQDTG